MRHIPVLLQEILDGLKPKEAQNLFVDATLGDAGHSEAMLRAYPELRLIGIDTDPEAVLRAGKFLESMATRARLLVGNFSEISELLGDEQPDLILADLGWSTPQFSERGRGFSFLHPEEPLDMRYSAGRKSGQTRDLTAAELLAGLATDEIESILRLYGEEPQSALIAEEIVRRVSVGKMMTAGDLSEAALGAYRRKLRTDKEIPWIGGLHPATRTFQAVRIAVNHELERLKEFLKIAPEILKPGGRLAVITFHSLEDRIVKQTFRKIAGTNFTLPFKKPVIAGEEEWKSNPPSRSAKLRIIEKK